MVSKAEQIREMSRAGASPDEIAEELGYENKGYIYKVRSRMDSITGGEPVASDPTEESDDRAELEDALEEAEEELEQSTVEEPAEDAELDLEDTEAKTYECGDCDAPLEYLQKECSECGARPMWHKLEELA